MNVEEKRPMGEYIPHRLHPYKPIAIGHDETQFTRVSKTHLGIYRYCSGSALEHSENLSKDILKILLNSCKN